MIHEDDDTFGGAPHPTMGEVVPFPSMRPSSKLDDAWRAEVAVRNKQRATKLKLNNPLDGVEEIFRQRAMPAMWWPAPWIGLSRRMRTYPGDMTGVVGSQGGGKTSFAIQIGIANTANGTPVVWAPLELDEAQVNMRIAANMHGVHAAAVRENWSRERLNSALTAIADMWHHVDKFSDPDVQVEAIRDAVDVAWKIYRVPPLLVVDHVGKLAARAKDPRVGTLQALEILRDLTNTMKCYALVLSQGSRGSQAMLTGKVDADSAADSNQLAAESKSFEDDCANVVALAVYKSDDVDAWDARAMCGKCRHTGGEGQVGMRFSKPGGVWSELDYLPATPLQEKAMIEADKKDKHRAVPPRSPAQARSDINAANAGDAAAMIRKVIYAALLTHGALGMELQQIRLVRGAGRGPAVHRALQELERQSLAERVGSKWRAIARSE